MAPFESQKLSIRNAVISANKQLTYGELMADAALTHRLRFDPKAFAVFKDTVRSDMALVGKGHPFASERQLTARDCSFGFTSELYDFLAGWMLAMIFGKDTITGAGPYTHTFNFDLTTNIAVATTIYIENDAAVKRKLKDMSATDLTISWTDKGPITAQINFVGTGLFADGAMAALPALPTNAYLMGSDVDVQIGPVGAPVSIKGRCLSGQVKISTKTVTHRAPGGGLSGFFNRVGMQEVTSIELVVAATNANDMDTLWENQTEQEVKIIVNSGAAAQLTLDFPSVFFNDSTPQVDAERVAYKLSADANNIRQAANPIVTATVINSQATAYLVGA